MQDLYKKIKRIEKQKRLKIGFYASQFDKKDVELKSNEGELFPSASIIKILLAIVVFEKIKNNQIKLDDYLIINNKDFVIGASVIADMKIKKISIYNLLYFLLSHSDNTAQVILERMVNKNEILNFFNQYDIDDFSYVPYKEQFENNISLITPYEIAKLFKLIYENKIINEHGKKIFQLLLSRTRITYMGLRFLPIKINIKKPKIVSYYSKSGKNKNTMNECMVLKTNNNKILNINLFITNLNIDKFSNNVDNSGAVLIGELALLIYNTLDSLY